MELDNHASLWTLLMKSIFKKIAGSMDKPTDSF